MAKCVVKKYEGKIRRNGGVIRVGTTETREKLGDFMRTTIYANGEIFYSGGKEITSEPTGYAKSEHRQVIRLFKGATSLEQITKKLGEIF